MIRRILSIAVLFGSSIVIGGCGSADNEMVTGVTPDFLEQVEKSKSGYGEAMKEASAKGPGG